MVLGKDKSGNWVRVRDQLDTATANHDEKNARVVEWLKQQDFRNDSTSDSL